MKLRGTRSLAISKVIQAVELVGSLFWYGMGVPSGGVALILAVPFHSQTLHIRDASEH